MDAEIFRKNYISDAYMGSIEEKLTEWFGKPEKEEARYIFHIHGRILNHHLADGTEKKADNVKKANSASANIWRMQVELFDRRWQEIPDHHRPVIMEVGNRDNEFHSKEFISGILYYEPEKQRLFLSRKNMYRDFLSYVKERIEAEGPDGFPYQCNRKVLEQFLCALDTNQIIILHGAPGMGKTSLVRRMADALGAKCRIIPVRPNWVDSQDLMGFFNPVEHRYYSTPFLEALCEAKEHPGDRYFICLDEMNLSHAEYYLSDILSVMESKEPVPLYPESEQKNALTRIGHILSTCDANSIEALDARIDRENLSKKYTPDFMIPENVQFIGTLNMDETTCDLSPKIIDRSFIIKVTRDADAPPKNTALLFGSEADVLSLPFVRQLCKAVHKKVSKRIERQLLTMQKRMDAGGLSREIHLYDYMDYIIACKILPMLNGEDIEMSIDDGESLIIGELPITGGDSALTDDFPLSADYLKSMCDVENRVINYWRMN